VSNAKWPITVIGMSNGGSHDYPTATLRDATNNTHFIAYEAARQINECYKIGDTIK